MSCANGLTKREIFAMTILPGVLSRGTEYGTSEESLARAAVRLADDLIEALNR